MKRMAEILEAKQQKKLEDYKSKAFAEKLDRIGFVIYITLGVIYVCCMVAIAKQDFCSENNLDFWTDW